MRQTDQQVSTLYPYRSYGYDLLDLVIKPQHAVLRPREIERRDGIFLLSEVGNPGAAVTVVTHDCESEALENLSNISSYASTSMLTLTSRIRSNVTR